MRSMTGYGEKSFETPGLRVKISVKSLNHRFFDWNYRGAPLAELENGLRALAQKKLQRGRVEAAVDIAFLDTSSWEISINEGLLEKILSALEKTSRRMGKKAIFSVDNIFRIPQVIELRRKDFSAREKAFLARSFDATLEEVLKGRCREGRETARKIKTHLRMIRQSLRRIEKLAKVQPSLFRQKVQQRLTEIKEEAPISQGRVEEEVAYLAQRSDITEEILRLHSHVDAFQEWVREEKKEPAGKMLDFLSQEIYREANTVNSKSQNIELIRESLVIKGEIESIRQHVQNLE